MNQIKSQTLNFLNSILTILIRDIKLQLRSLSDIFGQLTFLIISTLIFVFSLGPDQEQLALFGISILWSLLILLNSILINKSLKEDYEDGNLAMYQFTGLSFELISINKIIASWILYQIPVILIMPILCIILNISPDKIYSLLITILIGSPSLTMLSLISGAMMLTNERNLTLGSLIMIAMSIPIVIFAIGAINTDLKLFEAQLYILFSILLAFLAISPWVISTCIKIAIKR